MAARMRAWSCALAVIAVLQGCTNNPYPFADAEEDVIYQAFTTPPKTLDPTVAYSTADHAVTEPIYDTLLEYHFLARPYTLIPALAEKVPEAQPLADGKVSYRFRLRPDLLFHADPAFGSTEDGQPKTRQVVAGDIAFSIMRIADPEVGSPVRTTFAKVEGFEEFATRLTELRKATPEFAKLRIDEQYARAGGISGLRLSSPLDLEVVLVEPYPQILYWFAMEFTTPLAWEAITYYDGEDGRPLFSEHAVGTGAYRLAEYDKRSRIALELSPDWYGVRHPEWRAPAAVYPDVGEPQDRAAGRLDARYVGKPLPLTPRVEMRLEREPLPAFSKFLQGYYDASAIAEESFDQIVAEGSLTPEMAALGMNLSKTVMPAVYYLGFNMDDAVVGTPGGERSRKLRQAMSLAIDSSEFVRIFLNDRGIPAGSPIPPGIFGYDAQRVNPYRKVDLERARALLAEAGFAGGIDPATGKPLRLSFDTGDTSARGRVRYEFITESWRKIGLDVQIAATTYNQFQDKVRRGAYQIFLWGWVADYPDPENFLALLWGPMGRASSGGSNTANFADPRYDSLFVEMRSRPNDERRRELIAEMVTILEQERPWIELFFPEDYVLSQGWLANVKPFGMSISTLKYQAVDPVRRAELRAKWNEPILWPAIVLAIGAVVAFVPGVITYLKERQ